MLIATWSCSESSLIPLGWVGWVWDAAVGFGMHQLGLGCVIWVWDVSFEFGVRWLGLGCAGWVWNGSVHVHFQEESRQILFLVGRNCSMDCSMALNGPYCEAALGSIRAGIHAFPFVFLIPTWAFRAQTVAFNKTTEIANATACLFTYCLLVCPKCGNNVSRDSGIHVPVEDPGSCPGWYCIFRRWFIHSWAGGRAVPAVPPLHRWWTAWWCFHREASCLQVKPE